MPAIDAFAPYTNGTVAGTAITTATTLTLPTRATNGADTVRLVNVGPSVVYVEVSGGTATVLTSLPIFPNAPAEKLACPAGVTGISMITLSGTATLFATLGKGN